MVQNETARPHGRIYPQTHPERSAYLSSAVLNAPGRRRAPKTVEKLHTSPRPLHYSITRMTQPPRKKAMSSKKKKKTSGKSPLSITAASGANVDTADADRSQPGLPKMWDVFADGQGMTDPLMTGSRISCTLGL